LEGSFPEPTHASPHAASLFFPFSIVLIGILSI